jgi:hypothetical protein
MRKKLSTIALVVLVAVIAFACGNMVTEVEAQTSKRIYIGTFVAATYSNGQPSRDNAFAVYEENGEIKTFKLW